ncbi:MAG: type II toxin-antitoxin system RelE/ParE family toxin [Deltaproteobacteria bacterium]|nr:type II toxin-antitoxin system RelE/ParE family toxin [Deltaproteobacteria bacterium]
MKYSFHEEAEKELNDAIDYYNECQNGLGYELVEEVYSAIQNILLFPHAWAPLSQNTRRCLTNRFPYGVIYQITHDEIFIIAVMQLNREPGYWKNREKTA